MTLIFLVIYKKGGFMRSEKEVMNLIIDFAKSNNKIKAVIMNGSRVNDKIKKDKLQDYDIVYVSYNVEAFIENRSWIRYFGDVCIMQTPDESSIFKVDNKTLESFGFLVQYFDIRIDFTVCTTKHALNTIITDSLTRIILDKENLLPKINEASDEDYILKRPTKEEFKDCCNEFWWVSVYIAKGLYRNELLYAIDHLNLYVRPMYLLMLKYKAGFDKNYKVSFGKNDKYLPNYLNDNDLTNLKKTYPTLERDVLWDALFNICEYFEVTSVEVGNLLGYTVDMVEIENSYYYLNKIYNNEI